MFFMYKLFVCLRLWNSNDMFCYIQAVFVKVRCVDMSFYVYVGFKLP
jgi:hypothetical protein